MEQDLKTILDEQLRGLHLPEAIGWWPLALGWWILLVLVIALTGLLIWKIISHRKNNLYKKQAVSDLKSAYSQWQTDTKTDRYLYSANELIKRAIMAAAKNYDKALGSQIGSKTGSEWEVVLNQWSSFRLSKNTIFALTKAQYQSNPTVGIETLQTELSNWLKAIRQPKKLKGNSGESLEKSSGESHA